MARPTNKKMLLAASEANFKKLLTFVKQDSILNLVFPEGYLNTNVRDVLAHLYHWHLLFLDWHTQGVQGKKPDIPAKGYTWKTTPELNRSIQKKYQNTPYNTILKLLNESHFQLQNIINNYDNESLFTKKKYFWTGSTSLGAYIISATSSHYDWAYKLIKKVARENQN